jgi:hypothetical protein
MRKLRICRTRCLAIAALCFVSGCKSTEPDRFRFQGEVWRGETADFVLTMEIHETSESPEVELVGVEVRNATYLDKATNQSFPITGDGFHGPNELVVFLHGPGNRNATFTGDLDVDRIDGVLEGMRASTITGAPFDFGEIAFSLERQ